MHVFECYNFFISTVFGSEWSIAIAPTSGISVTLGSFVLLPCDPPAANPPPNVVWTRDGTALEPGDTSKYKVLAPEDGGSLIIANVNSSDIGPIYRCRVTNALVFVTRDSPFSYQLDQIG